MTRAAAPRPGDRFAGRYEVLRTIGQGGMGVVYEAVHLFTGRHVALKVLDARVSGSGDSLERHLREARAPSSVVHPAMVEVLDAGVGDGGQLYLAFELLEGEDLAAELRAGAVSSDELVKVLIEVLDALAAAHAAGLVHRDIKPENVFLAVARDAGGARRVVSVKLLDFGVTRHLEILGEQNLTDTGIILGTPDYMSPEQARGEHVDGRSDLFSVGVVLFTALAGRPPLLADSRTELILALAHEQAPPIRSVAPHVPDRLAAIVDQALRHDPAQRWPSAEAMRDALAACVGAASPRPAAAPAFARAFAPTVPVAARPRRGASRLAVALVAVFGGVALAGGLALGFWLVAGPHTRPRAEPATVAPASNIPPVQAVPVPAAPPAYAVPVPVVPVQAVTVPQPAPVTATTPPVPQAFPRPVPLTPRRSSKRAPSSTPPAPVESPARQPGGPVPVSTTTTTYRNPDSIAAAERGEDQSCLASCQTRYFECFNGLRAGDAHGPTACERQRTGCRSQCGGR